MNIIFFSNSCWSLYNFRRNFLKEFIKKGYRIYIVSNRDNTTKLLEKIGCNFIELKFNTTEINYLNELLNIYKFIKILFKIRPKIVFSFTVKPILYSTISSYFSKFKVVITFDGLGRLYDKKSFSSYFYILLLRIFNKNILKIYLVNLNNYRFILNNKITTKKNIELIKIGTGIDTQHYKFNKLKNFNTFLFLGRYLPTKGIIEFCESAKYFKNNNKNTKFLAVGNYGKDDISLISKKKILSYKNYVKFYFNKKDVRKYISNSTCVVLPSYYNEGLNRSLMEALSMGRIIITTNVPGCSELLNKNKNGYTIKAKSEISIIKEINKVLNSKKKKLENMSKRCRKFILKNYSDKYIINKYIKLTKIYEN